MINLIPHSSKSSRLLDFFISGALVQSDGLVDVKSKNAAEQDDWMPPSVTFHQELVKVNLLFQLGAPSESEKQAGLFAIKEAVQWCF